MQKSITTRQKVLYGAGDIMGTVAFTVTALFLPYFFTDVLGLPSILAGVTILIGNFWDAITDPYAGYISDKTHSRFGRRRPFFLYMALPIGLTFILLFAIPAGMTTAWTFILSTLAYLAFMTTTTFYLVPYLAYGMEIERSYDGRTSITAWRMLFSIGFGLIGAVVPKMIWESASTPSQGFLTMALIFAVPIAISPLFPFLIGKEPAVSAPHQSSFLKDFTRAMKNNNFVKGIVIFIVTWTGINTVQTLLIYYFKYVVNIANQFEIVIGVLFGTAIISLPLWVFLSKKLDKRKAYILGAAAFALLLLFLALPAPIVLRLLWVMVPLLGIALSSLHVMPTAILPEAIEETTEGSSGEGTHYGIVTFIYKIANAFTQFGVLGILGIAGYIETTQEMAVQQPQSAITAIRILIVAVPVILMVVGIVTASRFQISRHNHGMQSAAKGCITMSVTVRRIEANELYRFLKLPFRLYRKDPNWVPPLFSEMRAMLDPSKNPFLKSGDHAFFMAFRGSKAVARVLAGFNNPVSQKTGVKNGYFALFEAEDKECGLAVLKAAADYCKSLGTVRMMGPYSPTNGEEERALLIEGFGFPPVLYTSYNPVWYKDIFEEFELQKSSDLLAFLIDIDKVPIDRFRRVVSYAEKRQGFSARRIDLNNLQSELRDIQSILHGAAIDDWDSGIPSWEMIEQAANSLKTLADPDLIYIVRTNAGQPLAFVVSLPNYNEVLIHLKGKLIPFGFLKFLYWRKKIKGIRVMMQFCIREYEGTGAVSSAYLAIMEKAIEKGYKWAEASTIGEENFKSWRAVQGAGGHEYRRYRWYVKEL